MTPSPVFVIGLARSGTNLLARMLGRHPRVSMALDPLMPLFKSLRNAMVANRAPADVAARFNSQSPFQDYYFDPDAPALLDAILGGHLALPVAAEERGSIRRAVQHRAGLESPELGERLAAIDGGAYGDLVARALEIIAAGQDDVARVGIKEVWIFEFVPMLAAAFPDARFYMIDRDPRAIVASLVSMARKDPTQAAHVPSYLRHWRKSIALARRFEADATLRDRFRVVSYERLVIDAEAEARRLCGELGLRYLPAMLELSAGGWRGNSSFGEGRDIYTSSAEQWRTVLDAEAIGAIEFLCGPEMSLTDYAPSAAPAPAHSVLSYLQRAAQQPGSWRSDSGDPVVDVGGELLRRALLEPSVPVDESLARRCFLFLQVLNQVRVALRSVEFRPARQPV